MYATVTYPHTELPENLAERVQANRAIGHVTFNLDLLYLSMPADEALRLAQALIDGAAVVNAHKMLGTDKIADNMTPAAMTKLAARLIEQAAEHGDDEAMRIVVTMQEAEEQAMA